MLALRSGCSVTDMYYCIFLFLSVRFCLSLTDKRVQKYCFVLKESAKASYLRDLWGSLLGRKYRTTGRLCHSCAGQVYVCLVIMGSSGDYSSGDKCI